MCLRKQKCRIRSCSQPPLARALCSKHYQKWAKYGDPLAAIFIRAPWDGCCRYCGKSDGPFYGASRKCAKCQEPMRRAWVKKNPDRHREIGRANKRRAHARFREAVLCHYKRRCACCRETRTIFLAVDHIGGGGSVHRKRFFDGAGNIYRWLVRNNFPPGFRLLCHNCNYAEAHGGCPHKRGMNELREDEEEQQQKEAEVVTEKLLVTG